MAVLGGPSDTGAPAWNVVANKLSDPATSGAPVSPAQLQAWLAGSTVSLPAAAAANAVQPTYAVVASGSSDAVPAVALGSRRAYRLTITLPFPAPGALTGPLGAALRAKGLTNVAVATAGNQYVIVFTAP